MADRRIGFSAPMIRALLDGRKTQTRRLAKPRGGRPSLLDGEWSDDFVLDQGNAEWLARDIPFAAGDRAYVREHWKTALGNDGVAPRDLDPITSVLYLADGAERGRYPVGEPGKHRQGMHMPRWASRLTLFVEAVRVQRLQDISEADAIAEGGVEVPVGAPPGIPDLTGWHHGQTLAPPEDCFLTARFSYRHLWNSLHTEPGTRWDDNPWIYALTFRVARGNIDNLETDRG